MNGKRLLMVLALFFVCVSNSFSETVFFDDFIYDNVDDPKLTSHGWKVINELSSPPENANYTKDNVGFVYDLALGSKVLLLKADRPIYEGKLLKKSAMSRIETPILFKEGTFAAYVSFDTAPRDFKDESVQTFYLINQFSEYCSTPGNIKDYSEVDFEFLPYNFWNSKQKPFPTLYMHSWAVAGCNDSSLNKNSQSVNPYAIWYYPLGVINTPKYPKDMEIWSKLLVNIGDNKVTFFNNDIEYPIDQLDFYPKNQMMIALAHWINNTEPQKKPSVATEYSFKVDWIFYSSNSNLSWNEIEERIREYRNQGIARLPDPSDSGLVAYYPFNGNANDASGNGNNGTVTGATLTTDRFGNPNSAYSFSGNASSYIQVPRSASIEPQNAISISFWMLRRANGSFSETVIRKTANCGPGYLIWGPETSFTAKIDGINACSGEASYINVDISPDLNEWAFYTFVYDTTNGGKFYINGIQKASSAPLSPTIYHSGDLFIGGSIVHGGDGGVDGVLDDIRIYNRTLSDSEIHALYSE
jgi:hypothetical protein